MDRLPRKNLSAKILALILASILWVYVMNEQNPSVETTFQSPVEVRNLDDTFVVQDVPEIVRVRVRGPRNIVTGVALQDVKSYVDLKGLIQGKHSVRVHTLIPANLELIEIQPDKIQVSIDSIVARNIPVEVKLTGNQLQGTVLGKTASPVTQVKVEGLKSRLDVIDRVIAKVDMTNRSGSFTAEVPLEAVYRDGTVQDGLTISPSKISIGINLYNETNKKLVPIQPVTIDNVSTGMVLKAVTVDPEKIEIYGDPQTLAKTEALRTEMVSLVGVDKDADKVVKLQVSEGIYLKTNTVTMHIQVVKK